MTKPLDFPGPEPRKPMDISTSALEALAGGSQPLVPLVTLPTITNPYKAAQPIAKDEAASQLAMDWDGSAAYTGAVAGGIGDGLGFLGYPFLAELTQRPEYRRMSEVIAEEMTREWIRLTYAGDEDKTDRVSKLEAACERYHLRERFQEMATYDGWFGRGQLYIDTGASEDRPELQKPLIIDRRKIAKGSLRGFVAIEPMWSYPLQYNSDDPLRADFFRPQAWSVQGKSVHHSRLLTFVSRPMPDLLKPAYAFGGLSLSQIAIPYVQNWLRTRQSVSDLIHAFSILILATKMGDTIQADGMATLIRRVEMATRFRDNRGLQLIDKESEEMSNIAVPLGTLDALQAQSQEQMASVSGIPLVKLLGIQPAGLNASSDGEIRVFYDHIAALQAKFFGQNLKRALDIIQLSEFGDIDENIGFEFVPLWQLDEAGEAEVRKADADTDIELINAGVISPEESRRRLAGSPKSPYAGLDVSDVPEPPQDDMNAKILADPAKSAEPRKLERSGV